MKTCLKAFFIFLFVYASGGAAGQSRVSDGALSGTVTDASSGRRLAYVQVYIEALAKGDVTDPEGRFRIENIVQGRHRIFVSLLGYALQEIQVVVEAGETTTVSVALEPKAFSFDEVQVTAGRHGVREQNVSQLVNILSSGEIRDKNISQTPELLQDEVGLFLQKTNHGGGSPIIRGFRANKLLLMVDGIRMNNATYRGGNLQYLNTIDSQSIDQIEVVHGPASALYGSDALGGAVNLITRVPKIQDGPVSISGSASSRFAEADDSAVYHGDIEVSAARFGLSISGTRSQYGDIRRGDIGGDDLMNRLRNDSRTDRELRKTQTPNGYTGTAGMAKAVYQPGSGSTVTAALQFDRQKRVPRYDVYESRQFERWHYDPQERDLAYLRWGHKGNGRIFDAAVITASRQRQMERRVSQRRGSAQTHKQQFETRTTGLQLQLNRVIMGRHFLVYGAEVYWDRVSASSSIHDANSGVTAVADPLYPDASTQRSFGAYAQGEFFLTPLWRVNAGLRYSAFNLRARFDTHSSEVSQLGDVRVSLSAITASAGSVLRISDQLRFVTHIAQGFRSPNLDDLSKLGPGKGGNFYDVPNIAVQPERVLSIDGGIKYVSHSSRLTLLAYTSRITDLLLRREAMFLGLPYIVAGSDTLAVFHKENAGKAYTAGIEAGLEYLLSEHLMVQLNLSVTRGKNVTFSEPLTAIPPLNGLFRIQWKRGALALSLSSRFAQAQDRLSSEDEQDLRIPEGGAPGWVTLNIRSSYQINNQLALRFDVANLFDRNYREHLSGINARGRDFVVAAEASF